MTLTPAQPLTQAQLDEWTRLCDAATGGPWCYEPHGDTGQYGVGVILDDDENHVKGLNENTDLLVSETVAIEVDRQPDAAFIAAARTALPALIAEVERLSALNADESKPRYTTRRLRYEIERATEKLSAERDGWQAQIGKIANLVPIPEILKATGTTADLIAWLTDRIKRTTAAEAERDRLRAAAILVKEKLCEGFCHGFTPGFYETEMNMDCSVCHLRAALEPKP